MIEIDKFIEEYNSYLFLKMKDFSDVVLIEKKLLKEKLEDKIDYFFESFRFPSKYLYSGFYFDDGNTEYEELQYPLIRFASHIDYSLEYVYNKETGYVGLWSYESNDIEWYCASSLEDFFRSMTIVMKIKRKSVIKFYKEGTFELEPTILKSAYKECMKINDNKFLDFYTHIIGLDD